MPTPRPAPPSTAPRLHALTALALAAAVAFIAPPSRASGWPADTTLGLRVCAATGDQIDPLMVGDESGGFIMLWTDYRKPGNDPDLYCQRVSANGDTLWGPGGLVVCDAVGIQIRPTLVSDGHGGAFMAWADLRSSGAFGYYLQHIAANGVRRWAANGVRPVAGFNSQFGPQICRDSTGGVFLAFASGSPGTQLQRIDSLGIARIGFFPPAEGPVLRSNPSAPLAIVPDGQGGAIVALGYGGTTPVDIAAQRVTAAGTQLWAAGGVTVCAASGSQGGVRMVSDGAGGAILAWDDARVAAANIYMQRVSAAGAATWTANGVALGATIATPSGVQLRAQSDGSTVAVWRDYRHLPASSLYAQRVQADSTFAWPAGGRPVCSALAAIERYSVVGAAGDSTFVAWNTTTSSGADVFAQKLDGDGEKHWGEYGATVCRGPLDQTNSASVADGSGGLLVGYRDQRVSSDPDLHAQHLLSSGLPGPGVLDVPPARPASPGALRGSPNPARGVQVIAFGRAAEAGGRVDVIDVLGRRRVTRSLAPGATSWSWDGRDDDGARVEPGVYLVRVTGGRRNAVARVLRLD